MLQNIPHTKIQTPVPFAEREYMESGYQIIVIGFSPKNFPLLADKLKEIGSHSPFQWDANTNWLRVSFHSNESYERALKLHDTLLNYNEKIAVFSESLIYKPKALHTATMSNEQARIMGRKEKSAFKTMLEYLCYGWF